MTYQDFIDFLDEEILKATQKLIAEHPEAEVHIYKRLKIKIENRLKKEAKNAVAER